MRLISSCPNHMNGPLSYIAPPQVGTVRVYHNIVPVSVGTDAIGGSVLVDPASPVFAGRKGQTIANGDVGAFWRSNGDQFGGYLSGTAANDWFSISYVGSYSQSYNYYAGADFHPGGPAFTVGPYLNNNGNVSPLPFNKYGQLAPWIHGNEVGSTSYQAQNHQVTLAVHKDNYLLRCDIGVQNIPYEAFPNMRMDETYNVSEQVNLKGTAKYDWGVLEAQAYNQNVSHGMDYGADKMYWYYDISPLDISNGMPMRIKSNLSGAKLTASIDLSDKHILRVGTEAERYIYNDWWPSAPATLPPGVPFGSMSPNTFWVMNNGTRDFYDVFLEWDARWNPKWTTQLGVRSNTVLMNTGNVQGYNQTYDQEAGAFNSAYKRRTFENWNATALAIYTPSETQTYSFGYSLKSQAPNLYELYAWSSNPSIAPMIGWYGDGNYYVGNLNLVPQIANVVSATADWHDRQGNYGLQASPYYSYVLDYIDVERLPSSNVNYSMYPGNSALTNGFVALEWANCNAQIFGADMKGHALLAKDTAIGDLGLKGVASYVRGTRSGGQNLYQMMPLNGTLTLEQKIGGFVNAVQGQFVMAKNTVEELRNEIPTSAYALLNLSTSYEWKNVRVTAGISNALNSLYYLPLGGAYIGQGATMTPWPYGPAWGIALPGMGRMFYVSGNLTF